MGLLDGIPYSPQIVPADWCTRQPCLEVAGITLSQPSSSVIVYLTAFVGVWVGWKLFSFQNGHESRKWFGISLILGGIGAFLAGTSYQAFGYEIKCAGRDVCNWTSWWELGYELTTVVAAAYLLLAVVKMCFPPNWLSYAKRFSVLLSVSYGCVLVLGVAMQNSFLLSFELMLLFSTPLYIVILVTNLLQWTKTRNNHIGKLTMTWILLFSVLFAYYTYLLSGCTEFLWHKGVWFSANDVLHVGMILWLLYIHFALSKSIKDGLMTESEHQP
jgi:hypothetical protein